MTRVLKPKPLLAFVAVALLAGTLVGALLPLGGTMQARASDIPTLRNQMQTIATSASAQQVRAQTANIFTDPALGQWANELIVQGGANLTAFQLDLMKAAITENSYGDVIAKVLNGASLSANDKQRFAALKNQLSNNPSIQKIVSTGAQLKGNQAALTQDINTTVSALTGPRAVPSATGDAPLDAVVSGVSTVTNGASFAALSTTTLPILQDPGAAAYVASQPPEIVAAFIPSSQILPLLLPNDRDPLLSDREKAGLKIVGDIATGGAIIVGGFGAIAAAAGIIAATGPVAIGLAITVLVLGTIGWEASTLTDISDLGQALDCDNDGDPWDSSDTIGIEC